MPTRIEETDESEPNSNQTSNLPRSTVIRYPKRFSVNLKSETRFLPARGKKIGTVTYIRWAEMNEEEKRFTCADPAGILSGKGDQNADSN